MSHVIDGREMAPPEPLEATLAALDTLTEDEELVLLLYCHPRPLFEILGKMGATWTEAIQEDGTHVIRIRRR